MSPLKGTEREFSLDGVKNARDLGGIPLPGGGVTAFGRFLRTDAPRGAVIHCTAGKDRTGVVCALLLANAGVGVEEIAADYALTQQRMGGVLERVCRENPALCYDALVAREENMLRFWEMYLDEYGDVESYFERIGLEKERIVGLREKLRG